MSCKIDLKKLSTFTTLIGAFLLTLPTGVIWYYGNMSPYLISYLRFHVGLETASEQTDWVVPTFMMLFTIGLLTLDFLVHKFGLRWLHLAEFLTFDLAMFLTYFTVQHSVGLTLLTLSVICGLTTAHILWIGLILVSRSMPGYEGVATAFVSCAFGLGATLFNIITTVYINPDNLTPDVRQKNMAFFSQETVIHNVPSVFLVMGAVSLCLHLLGFCLEQLPAAIVNAKTNNSLSSNCNEHTLVNMLPSKDYKTNDSFNSDSAANENIVPSTVPIDDSPKDIPQTSAKEDFSLKPYEVLRTRSFYQIWISLCILGYSALVNLNFYKSFGQLWIKDDSFLASMASVAAVTMSLFRIVCGFVIDKIGVKKTLILTLSMNAVMMPFWYMTPRIGRWFYFFFYQIINGVHGSIFILFPIAALKLFGPRYYATNYGLILTAQLVNNLVSPMLLPIFLDKIGWFGLFFVAGAGSVLALLSVMLGMSPVRIENRM